MHPEISFFPSREFYKSKILDGVSKDRLMGGDNFCQNIEKFFKRRVVFFDLFNSVDKTSKETQSRINDAEARFTYYLVKHLYGLSAKE